MEIKDFPTGIVKAYAGSSAPAGYLLCDGSAVSRTTYDVLFALIGTTYGAGDGSTTFNVPNIKGKIIVGKDSSDADVDTLGETGGAKTINIAHTHTHSHTHSISATSGGPSASSQSSNDVTNNFSNNGHTHTISVTSGNASASSSDSQLSATQTILIPYITMNYIIKV